MSKRKSSPQTAEHKRNIADAVRRSWLNRDRQMRVVTLEYLLQRTQPTATGCLEWQGGRGTNGYGQVSVAGVQRTTHRVAWELANSASAGEKIVLHSCDNPPCINPEHLRIGTHSDNARDALSRGRHRSGRGENHADAKLKESQVLEIRRRYALGETQPALAREFGVDQSLISYIVRGKIWKHLLPAEAL